MAGVYLTCPAGIATFRPRYMLWTPRVWNAALFSSSCYRHATLWNEEIWGFLKIRDTILGVPIIRNDSSWGSILGSPYFGKLPSRS